MKACSDNRQICPKPTPPSPGPRKKPTGRADRGVRLGLVYVDAWHFPPIGETVSMEPAEELFADRRPIDNRHPPNRRARWRVLPTAAMERLNTASHCTELVEVAVDLEELARKVGAIEPWERLAE